MEREQDTTFELQQLRRTIDALDRDIVAAIARRTALGSRIGEIKQEWGQPVLDPAREAAVVRRAAEHARRLGVNEEAVREVFWRLVGLARRCQRESLAGTP